MAKRKPVRGIQNALLLDGEAQNGDTNAITLVRIAVMINQRYCPYCRTQAVKGCAHLALAVEGRDFVNRCIEACHGGTQWKRLCQRRQNSWASDQPDFAWLETAFCDEFLRGLTWFGGMDHEWRSGPKPEQGGFWVLLWSKDPQRLWWELSEEIESKSTEAPVSEEAPPWLIFLNPK